MSWLQFKIALDTAEAAAFEAAMVTHGAAAVTFESQADEVVLEPAPGTIPMWQSINLLALFSLDTDISGLNNALRALDSNVHQRLDVAFIADEDWQQRLANHTVRAEFGGRLWVLPKSESMRVDGSLGGVSENANDAGSVLYLEPGLAFGSGSHPTTRMCLEWIASHVQPQQQVLDFGCGSGILAIAAALLGAKVVAVDHDDQALLATRENAEFNGVGQHIEVLSLVQWQDRSANWNSHFDVVVANILAAPIMDLASTFCRHLQPAGDLVLSGILQQQADEVCQAFTGIAFAPKITEEDWVCLTGSSK